MISRIIDWCIGNRVMVLLLTAGLVVAGVWSASRLTVDAIPDLSDVQVVIRADFPGQAPRIIEDQVTYPLTTAMLAVPHADVVRGFSMFGSSFVYIIFEDGTDLYWARSRVLEQLNTVASRLPEGVTAGLGPDATGVGWVYQYMLVTGAYCPEHPGGVWHDPVNDAWHASRDDVADPAMRARLIHHRVFDDERTTCPVDGAPLAPPDADLSDLRRLQDWYLRYELTAVEGVSEVASVGGFIKQYQITVDPVRLRAFNISLDRIKRAVQRSNLDVGGRIVERAEAEFMVRGLGYLGALTPERLREAAARGEDIEAVRTEQVIADLESIALTADAEGRPVYLRDVAEVRIGPDIRRGIATWNDQGEAVGAIVVMRFGENARATIERVRARLAELERGLPPGVAVRVGYDRSDLIDRAVGTLRTTLIEEMIIVAIVVTIFLVHVRSALVAIIALPIGVLGALATMRLLGVDANIMSLGGVAISIGVMVDSSIIMVENAHKHLERDKERTAGGAPPTPRARLIADAAKEVGPTLFFALLIITVSFLPVFALGQESGRLFKPLALTKTLAMLAASLLAITMIPALMVYLIRERTVPGAIAAPIRWALYAVAILAPAIGALFLLPESWRPHRWWIAIGWIILAAIALLPQRFSNEDRNPMNRMLHAAYEPFFALAMRFRWITLLLAIAIVGATLWPLQRLGSEFMPPLEEGDLLYMPTVDPGVSATKARELLHQTNTLIMQIPEVRSAYGKIGRADTATDPAPLTMIETTITLERDRATWRRVPVDRFFSGWPDWVRRPLERIVPATRPITTDELIYGYEMPGGVFVPGLNDMVRFPGLTNSWTMPIRTRIDMLSTGIRTPVGVKVLGEDLATLSDLADRIARTLQTDESTRSHTTSAFAEKTVGGRYLDIDIDRDAIARYGLAVADVQDVIMTTIGGAQIGTTVEGLERYPISLRYPRELRDDVDSLKDALVATPGGAQIPLAQLATFTIRPGPPMIKSENARLTSWVYVDIAGVDLGTYVRRAQAVVSRDIELPPGYTILWSGQYEYIEAARQRLVVIVPVTLALIVVLLYLATRSWLRVGIVLLALPFSLVGAIWLLYFMDYNLSLAVVVGLIALAGLDAETGLIMLLYLDNSYERFRGEGRMRDTNDLWWAVHDGAVKRIRPKTMTVATVFAGLLPLLWAEGAGADTMRRLAVPLIGGVATSFILELLIYPVLFYLAKRPTLRRRRTLPTHAPAAP